MILQLASEEEDIAGGLSFLKGKEKELLQFLIKSYRGEFTPIEVSRELSVTNKTIINRLAVLVKKWICGSYIGQQENPIL